MDKENKKKKHTLRAFASRAKKSSTPWQGKFDQKFLLFKVFFKFYTCTYFNEIIWAKCDLLSGHKAFKMVTR